MSDVRSSSSIAFFTFIPWFVSLILLNQTRVSTNQWSTIFQIILVSVLFSFSFFIFFKTQKQIDPYETALISGMWFLLFELVLYLLEPTQKIYNYVNWILPLFIVMFIIYGTGSFFKNKKTRH